MALPEADDELEPPAAADDELELLPPQPAIAIIAAPTQTASLTAGIGDDFLMLSLLV
ncbi:MAG TPA: hypothetical protein VIK04_10205 [Solirubrobacteraceae bacterium]